MRQDKIISVLKKVLAGDVLPFKKPEKPNQENKKNLILDWGDADIYPVSGTKIKLLGVFLKGVGPDKRFMLSLIPKTSGAITEISFQLDEVGGEFCKRLNIVQFKDIEKYIKEKLSKDIEVAYSKVANIKVIQKTPSDFSDKLAQICDG